MASSVLILFLLPWLDRGAVKSIRYRGSLYKSALAIFVVAFLILGYLGTEPANVWGQFGAWLGGGRPPAGLPRGPAVRHFPFFPVQPWYPRLCQNKPRPYRGE